MQAGAGRKGRSSRLKDKRKRVTGRSGGVDHSANEEKELQDKVNKEVLLVHYFLFFVQFLHDVLI